MEFEVTSKTDLEVGARRSRIGIRGYIKTDQEAGVAFVDLSGAIGGSLFAGFFAFSGRFGGWIFRLAGGTELDKRDGTGKNNDVFR